MSEQVTTPPAFAFQVKDEVRTRDGATGTVLSRYSPNEELQCTR